MSLYCLCYSKPILMIIESKEYLRFINWVKSHVSLSQPITFVRPKRDFIFIRELWKLVPNFRCDWSFRLSTLDWLTNGPSGAGHVARGGARNTREKKNKQKNYDHLKWRKVLACPAFCITWLTSWKGPIDWTWLIRDWLIATLCATVRKPLSLEHYYVIIRYILFVLYLF